MAQKSGFFDTTSDDPRMYPAREFAEYFARFVGNGIYGGGVKLKVSASGADSQVSIATGYGWINGYLYSVFAEPLVMPLTPATTLDRIDRIVLRLNVSTPVRTIKAVVLQGTPNANPTPPALTRAGDIYDLSLAQVRMVANASIIEPYQVTDERLDNTVCGIVTGLIEQADTTQIFNEFNSWMVQQKLEYNQQWLDFMETIQDEGFASTDYVDAAVSTHANLTTAHGAVSAATANRLIVRDAAGRAKVAAPSAADDIARLDSITKTQVGLSNVENFGTATQAEAEAGTVTNKFMTPQRSKQYVDKRLLNDVSFRMNAGTLEFYTGGAWMPVGSKFDKTAMQPFQALDSSITGTTAYQAVLNITGKGYLDEATALGTGGNVQLRVTIDGVVKFEGWAQTGGICALVKRELVMSSATTQFAALLHPNGNSLIPLGAGTTFKYPYTANISLPSVACISPDALFFNSSLKIEVKIPSGATTIQYAYSGGVM